MEITNKSLIAIIKSIVFETLQQIKWDANKDSVEHQMSAVQKTESLLLEYNTLKKIVHDRESSSWYSECAETLGNNTVLDDNFIVHTSVNNTVHVLSYIEKHMKDLSRDPYYEILELVYFEGRTQEEIANHFSISQPAVSNHKKRLLNELAMRMFPDQAVGEIIGN